MTQTDKKTVLTILVVEDEPLIRMLAVDFVEEAGMNALEAGDADDAVLILERTEIDVLFTDIDMPGSMDGIGLSQLVRRRWPDIDIVVVSGQRHPIDFRSLPERSAFYSKPYDGGQIGDTLRRLLRERGGNPQ